MVVLVAVSLVLLTLAGVGAVCDRWGALDPSYSSAEAIAAGSGPRVAGRRSSAA